MKEAVCIVEERVFEYQLGPEYSYSIGAVVCPTNHSLLNFPSGKEPQGFMKLITESAWRSSSEKHRVCAVVVTEILQTDSLSRKPFLFCYGECSQQTLS